MALENVDDLSASQGKLLIAGMSRSGTTWLTRVLNMHSQVAAFGESLFWGRGYQPPQANGYYTHDQILQFGKNFANYNWHPSEGGAGGLKSQTEGKLGRRIKEEFLKLDTNVRLTPFEVFRHLCAAVAKSEGKVVGVEKTPHHVMWCDRIRAACPDYRMIVTIRDPYGFMLSYKHQGDRKDPKVRLSFERRYHPLACALVWKRYATAAASAKRESPDQVLLLDFAALRQEEDVALRQVQEFLRLPWENLTGSIPQTNSSFTENERPHLESEDIFWMNVVARDQIEAYGYTQQLTPNAPFRVLYSVFRLPWWAIWNFFDLRRIVKGSYWQFLKRWFTGR